MAIVLPFIAQGMFIYISMMDHRYERFFYESQGRCWSERIISVVEIAIVILIR